MIVLDARDIKIDLGSYVRYIDTGTVGKVIDFKNEEDVPWIKLEKTNLWYVANLVEVLDPKDLEIKDSPSEDDKKLDIEAIKEKKDKYENMELASNVAEGGG